MNRARIDALSRRIDRLWDSMQLINVTLIDGAREMRLPDVIPLLTEDAGCPVLAICGDPGEGSGHLLELVQGLINS